jgi:S-adenosylmethionine:tRNA ribosyltransferase-isomerase
MTDDHPEADLRLDAYDFDLPEAQIAQEPAARRDASRLLVLDRATGALTDAAFADLPRFLRSGDLLVLNDTRVFPARLRGTRAPGGGHAELLLIREAGGGAWEALARPGRKLGVGARVAFGDRLAAEVRQVLDDGRRVVAFEHEGDFWEALEAVGEPPLPPYIRRAEGAAPADRERYQTVYARERGAIAAPTAGLHFTPEVLAAVEEAGVGVARVTLHVGYGTFEPVRVEDLRAHRVAPEAYTIPEATAEAIARTRTGGGRVVAVGTTTTRALEAASDASGGVAPDSGVADLTITPGYHFRVVDALLTNFHLPRSSLLVLVGTFAGREAVLGAYRHAVAERYRFYSYGDAMLVL